MKTINGYQFMGLDRVTGKGRVLDLVLEETYIASMQLIVCAESNIPVGALVDDMQCYFIGDKVEVTSDVCGYITSGITKPGLGVIEFVVRDDAERFFNILMDNGESGAVKYNRIKVVE